MTELKKQLSEEGKSAYIRALLFVLGGKKNLSDEHKRYLKRQAEEINLPLSDLRKITSPLSAEELAKEIKRLSSTRLKRYIIREMIMFALADHEIADNEMQQIYTIGMDAGIKEDRINDFFLWAAKGLEWQLEGECLVEK